MKDIRLLMLPALLTMIVSCSKMDDHSPEPIPTDPQDVTYIDLSGLELKQDSYIRFDLNKDGVKDFYFSTMLIGAPSEQVDKVWFFVGSQEFSNLAINASEVTARLGKGEDIPLENFKGYNWYNVGFGLLVEKRISATNAVSWHGDWREASHQYLPVQILKDKQRFNGWFELSIDTKNEKVIFHRAAIHNKPEKALKAGL